MDTVEQSVEEQTQEVETGAEEVELSLREELAKALDSGEEAEDIEEDEEHEESTEAEEDEDYDSDEENAEESKFKVRDDLKGTFNYLKKDEREFLEKSELPQELVDKYLEKIKDQNTAFFEKTKNFSDVQKVLEPFEDYLAKQGITPAQKINQYIAYEKALLANPLEGILQLAESYGVDLVKSLEERQSIAEDPALREISELKKQLNEIKQQNTTQSQQSEEEAKQNALAQVEQFKSQTNEDGTPKYPLFDKIKINMGVKMQSGEAQSLEDAYSKVVSELGLDKLSQVQQKPRKSIKEAKKAAAVKGRSAAGSVVTEGMSLREELAYRMQNAKV